MRLLSEENGQPSSIRLIMLMCVLISGWLAIGSMYLDRSMFEVTGLVAIFLGGGIGGKVAQKSKETK